MESNCCNSNRTKTFEDLNGELHKIFAKDKVNIDHVKDVMNMYKSDPNEWGKYAKFDDSQRYTRNLVDRGNGKFNLMVLCWNKTQGSSIHDHANSHCFMKILDGCLNEDLFDWPENGIEKEMVLRQTNVYHKDETTYISDNLGLHRIENPSSTENAVSLHLYAPPFGECQCFDQSSGKAKTANMTFWSEFGKRTPLGAEQEK